MADIEAPPGFTGLPVTDARNAMAPASIVPHKIARAINHLAACHRTVLFNQHYQPDVQPTATEDRFLRYYFPHTWEHGHTRVHHVSVLHLGANPAAGQQPHYEATAATDSAASAIVDPGATQESGTSMLELIEEEAPTGSYQSEAASVFDGLQPTSIAIYRRRMAERWIESADGAAIEPMRFVAGGNVSDQPLIDLRDAFHDVWMRNRRIFAAWSAPGLHATGYTAAKSSNTGTPGLNLMDLASTSRTASTPGLICPAKYAGFGQSGVVHARVAVFADVTTAGDTGTVTFESSQNAPTIAVTSTAGAWLVSSTLLQIDTTIEYDKVDVFGRVANGTEQVKVWAWMIAEEPTP